MPAAEREDEGAAYEDLTGVRRMDCELLMWGNGMWVVEKICPNDGHRLHLRNSTQSTILGMALALRYSVAGHVSEDTDTRLNRRVTTEKRKPDGYHGNSFDYLGLEKTKLEVTVFDAELRDRAFHVETTLGGDAKERHTRSEASGRATAVDWSSRRALDFTALCIMPPKFVSWICSPKRNGLSIKVFRGARHRSKNLCEY